MWYEKLLIKCHLVSSLAKLPLRTCDIFCASFRSKTNILLRLFPSSACLATWKQYRIQQLFYSFSTAPPFEYNVFGLNLVPKDWKRSPGASYTFHKGRTVCLTDNSKWIALDNSNGWSNLAQRLVFRHETLPKFFHNSWLSPHLGKFVFFWNKSPVTLFSR